MQDAEFRHIFEAVVVATYFLFLSLFIPGVASSTFEAKEAPVADVTKGWLKFVSDQEGSVVNDAMLLCKRPLKAPSSVLDLACAYAAHSQSCYLCVTFKVMLRKGAY